MRKPVADQTRLCHLFLSRGEAESSSSLLHSTDRFCAKQPLRFLYKHTQVPSLQ